MRRVIFKNKLNWHLMRIFMEHLVLIGTGLFILQRNETLPDGYSHGNQNHSNYLLLKLLRLVIFCMLLNRLIKRSFF